MLLAARLLEKIHLERTGSLDKPLPHRNPTSERNRTMALMDYLRGQLIEIIEWTDDSRDTLSFRFPDNDNEIKRGAQLIVRESQVAQFVYLGEFGDTFGPGKHTLVTDNIPILTTLKAWKYGFESPFKADVYYVTTRLFTGNKWGTVQPDHDAGRGFRHRARARLRHLRFPDRCDPKPFLKEVAGTDQHFRLGRIRRHDAIAHCEPLQRRARPRQSAGARCRRALPELGEALLPLINPVIGAKYGIEMTSFIVENVSVPPEVEQAIDKRSSMAAVGNLNDYVKFQMAQGMEKGGGRGRRRRPRWPSAWRWRSRSCSSRPAAAIDSPPSTSAATPAAAAPDPRDCSPPRRRPSARRERSRRARTASKPAISKGKRSAPPSASRAPR